MPDRSVAVALKMEVSNYLSNAAKAAGATRDLKDEIKKATDTGKGRQDLDELGMAAASTGAVMVAGFGIAVGAAAQFEKQMSAVSAATHASAGDLNQLRDAALQAGKDTAYSATEAAKGIEELSKAGISTADILGGGLSGALNLAAAGEIDVGEAAETAASAMTQFKLDGRDVGHIADLLAAGAGKAQGSVHDMSAALNQSGLVASQMGLSVEETVGSLTAFASAGLMGSDAGTSLKTALIMLANPTDKAAGLMADLGIQVYDSQGQFIGMSQLAGQLQDRLSGLTQEQRNAALATIFGSDAIRAASILYENGASGIDKFNEMVQDEGYAAETAATKTDNLVGDLERLKGSLETMAIESGSGASGGLRVLTQGAGALVDQFAELPPAMGETVTVLAGVAGAALLAGAGWVRMRRTTADALAELRSVGPVGTRAASALERTSKWAGRASAAFIALEIASAVLSSTQKDLNIQTDALGKGLANWGRGGRLAGEAARVLGADMEDLGVGFKFLADTDNSRRGFVRWGQDVLETVVPGLDGTNTSLTRTRERVDAMDQALAGLVQGGSAEEADAAFTRLAQTFAVNGVSVEELKAQFPAYAAALETAGAASTSAAGGVTAVGDSAVATAEEIDKLKQAFDTLFDTEMGLDEATLNYKQGILELKDELKSGKRTLDENTQAGLDNSKAVLDQIKNIQDLRQARIDHGMALDEANGKYSTELEGLRATLTQLGYNKTEIEALVAKYKEIPATASTAVSAPGTPAATKQVQDFNFAIRNVPPSKTVPFWATTSEAKAAVDALKSKINELKDKHVYISGTVRWTSTGDLKVPGGTLVKNRWGGVYEHAAQGLLNLREAATFSATSPAQYAIAEPETGGEAFIPKYGDPGRSISIGRKAMDWYGMAVVPKGSLDRAMPATSGTSASGAGAVEARDTYVYVTIDGQQLEGRIDRVVRESNRDLKRRVGAGSGAGR